MLNLRSIDDVPPTLRTMLESVELNVDACRGTFRSRQVVALVIMLWRVQYPRDATRLGGAA